jgi:putative PIN family toxin of toxin-antitoxin system
VEKARNRADIARVVLDTNIVVSALVFVDGRLAPVRVAWHNDLFIPLISTATTEELIRVLSYPKLKLTAADREELLGDYLPFCTAIKIPAKTPKAPPYRDPWDLPFLQLAACGKARYMVTGDRDLLEIRDKLPYAIVSAETFMSALNLR